MKQPSFRLFLITVVALLCGPPLVWGLGSVLYEDPSTTRSIPKKTEAGYLKSGDGGVVSLMNAPAPTAVGQAIRITSIGTGTNQSAAGFVDDPVATTTGKGVVQLDTSARLSATTDTTTASATSTKVQAAGAMCILPKATTSAWGVSEFDTTLPLADGAPSVGTGGKDLQSNHVHPTEAVARAVYYPVGSGGVAPTQMSRQAKSTTDSFTQTLTTSPSSVFAYAPVGDPGITLMPAGTYKFRLWAYSTNNPCQVEWAVYLTNDTIIRNYSGYTTIAVGSSLVPYDLYATQSIDVLTSLYSVSLHMWAKSSTGTCDLTVGIGGTQSTSLSVPWSPSDTTVAAAVPLSSSAPPLVAAGPGTAGTGTSAQRSDSQQGLSASNPNRGDFYRSPTGTDTATNTVIGWDHATDIPRYAGSGAADPSQSPGVAGPVLSFYYQTAHSTDAGVVFDLWWKSGGGDTAWTRLASGSGSGSPPALDLTSPLGTITIGSGGGHTTEDVVYGHAAHTALQGSEWNAASGVCPLDPNTMVPLANLYASTESHAGTMSAADKIILDNMVSDTYEVKVAAGTTPGYLSAIVESPDSSITWSTSGNYLTGAVNFGTGTSQVCSGSTCAGLQPALPVCYQGQELVNGTLTNIATGTNTTSDWTCRTSPWQPAGSYEPAQSGKPGQIEMFGTTTATGTATTTTTVKTAQNPPWATSSGIGVSTVHNITTATGSATTTAIATAAIGDNAQVTIPVASASQQGIGLVTSNRNITTNTATITSPSTAGASFLPSDAQVVLPVASTTQAGIVPISTTARIGNTTVTTTASSTATKCLGEDALAIIPQASGVTGSGALNYYARWLNSSTLGTGNLTDYADASGSYCNGKFTVSGNMKMGLSAPDFQGPSTYGGLNLATRGMLFFSNTDGANQVYLASNAYIDGSLAWHYQNTGPAVLFGAQSGTFYVDTAASGTAGAAITWTTPISSASTPQGSGTSGQLVKWSGTEQQTNSILSDNGTSVKITSATYGEPGAFHAASGGDKVVLYDDGSSFDARIGVGTAGDVWVKASGSSPNVGEFRVFGGSTPTEWFGVNSSGITAANITATPAASKIPIADGTGKLDGWITNPVGLLSSTTASGSTTIPLDGSWVTILTRDVGGANSGSLMIMSTVTISGASGNDTSSRLTIDGAEIGGEEHPAGIPIQSHVTVSPTGYVAYSAGSHTVALQVSCTGTGSQCQVASGRAGLHVTQYSY